MADSMDIDPAVLRELALQHLRIADETDEWANQPIDWLNEFPGSYGHIANPVYNALKSYYSARENAGRALAKEHRDTAAKLRKAADDFERADDDGLGRVRRAAESPGAGAPPVAPVAAGPGTPSATGPQAGASNGVGPADVAGRTPGADNAAAVASGAPGTAASTSDDADEPGAGVAPAAAGAGAGAGVSAGSPGSSSGSAPGSLGVTAPGGAMPPGGPSGGGPDERAATAPPSGASAAGDLPPVPLPTPFAAAVAKAKDQDAEPAYVVGDAVDSDLVLARTLLGAVLAAVDSSVLGLHWAVAVMRGEAGSGVFITSNEGRGWFPAGLYLPLEVSSPWTWDELLGGDSGGAGSPWEGVSDPARVLVEFGLAWGRKAGANLTALVSSGPIDNGLRQRFTDVAMQDMVGPSYDVDLRVFTPDTADRLGLTGSAEALEHVASVSDAQVRARCGELATEAHALVARSAPGGPEAAESRGVRDRILSAQRSGRTIPREWWEELRDADDLLAAAMLPRRVDVGRVEPGELRIDDEVSALRSLVFERRCNELVLLLAEEESRQQLRDAVYAHEQIVKHPRFVEVPAAVATADEQVVRPSTASAGTGASGVAAPSVSAPSVTAGPPPGGAVVAPKVTPPDAAEHSRG
ncbi:type VII secretion target [Nocardia sp. NPDC052254]|uniref:type VII secretion target n=1 Tax=Nocardia sp. NPDC052254 TaxID=3155681 RepID=UPI003428C69E